MNNFKYNKITRDDFLKLKEKDLMFITSPGRMGDEDGTTFVIKEGNDFKTYRIDGWAYPVKDEKEEYKITMGEVLTQFPELTEASKHCNDKDLKGKYKYLYMGFGNGLFVDNSIYNEYEPYLKKCVEEYINSNEYYEAIEYAAIFNTWEKALKEMIDKMCYN